MKKIKTISKNIRDIIQSKKKKHYNIHRSKFHPPFHISHSTQKKKKKILPFHRMESTLH